VLDCLNPARAPSRTSHAMTNRPAHPLETLAAAQRQRNTDLLAATPLLGVRVTSTALPFALDPAAEALDPADAAALAALEKTAAAIAIRSLASLGRAGDIDHLGGGLELIPALLMTLGFVDYDARHFTIEHGHTSIGYYAALAALGFLPDDRVVDAFRRSLDVAGHVSFVAGGTELSSGRLGAIVPVAAGQALGLRARKGPDAAVICHCGDAGWVSGQSLNGYIAASQHRAPLVLVMHRNGIQLSGTTARVLDRDPRPVAAALGLHVIELASLHDRPALFTAYRDALALARTGQPALVYPTGYRTSGHTRITVRSFGEMYGIAAEVERFAAKHQVALDTEIWIPGSLMSFRDAHAMCECLFYVNNLPGGEGHHDGGMKGKDEAAVLANPLLQLSADESKALGRLRAKPPRVVVTDARPPKGSPNLRLDEADVAGITLPGPGAVASPRAGSEAAYDAVARKYPESCFFVSCDLDPSTKLGKAAGRVPRDQRFEMSIQEQAASLLANGLSFSSRAPQLNVFATFAAFFEGIAREGFEFWRYQRNLTGANEGLNVIMHLSHVGACTGRDHFSGWSLDWINLALGYLPYLRRFYAPADARAAFVAVRDAAACRGGHIVAIPRDNLPVLTRAGSLEPLWNAGDTWTPATVYREAAGASTAILAVGAPCYLAGAAADRARAQGVPVDAYVVNGFPLEDGFLEGLAARYRRIVTVEDGLIGDPQSGTRGFAGLVASHVAGSGVALAHLGIGDPRVAPSEHFVKVWEHFGITEDALLAAI
jgi:transketolase N-terminal domain/subunit/transketolase C-terminal domain/subunit